MLQSCSHISLNSLKVHGPLEPLSMDNVIRAEVDSGQIACTKRVCGCVNVCCQNLKRTYLCSGGNYTTVIPLNVYKVS